MFKLFKALIISNKMLRPDFSNQGELKDKFTDLAHEHDTQRQLWAKSRFGTCST